MLFLLYIFTKSNFYGILSKVNYRRIKWKLRQKNQRLHTQKMKRL